MDKTTKVYISNKAYKEYKNKKFRYLKKKFDKSLKNIYKKDKISSKIFTKPSRKNENSGMVLKEFRLQNQKFHLDYRVVYGINKKNNKVYIVDLFKKQRQQENNRIRDDYDELESMVVFDKYKKEFIISKGD